MIETAAACGYTTIIWDIDSLDWQDLSAAAMLERVQKQLRPGAIILFHNAGKHTPEAVAALLPILKSKGYSVVPVSQLLLKGETYTDHTGRQRLKRSSPRGTGQPVNTPTACIICWCRRGGTGNGGSSFRAGEDRPLFCGVFLVLMIVWGFPAGRRRGGAFTG